MATKPTYKLSCELLNHTGDVRALDVAADGSFVSTSRDKTAILWKCSPDGNVTENIVMIGHTNYVVSVCVMNPTQKHPKGLIITGGNDQHILTYIPGELQPLFKVKEHQNTVCCLSTSHVEPNSFLSSSWDVTAKLWCVNDSGCPEQKLTYIGHSAAVWSVVDLPNGSVVTGSADKTVIVYCRNSTILHKLEGHTDCVRAIASIKENEFLTCANDAVIKHWSAVTGDCLGNFYGHNNYIYSISAIHEGNLAVSSGEDKTLRVWCQGEVAQIIELPAQSIWCVKFLPNEDIVCGSSDGIVRIFSASPDRQADSATIQKFEEAVAHSQKSTEEQLGLKNVSDPSVLQQPGKKDGETKLVKEGDVVKAYNWSQSELTWVLIGEVTGSNPAEGGKQLLNGIEYDYVFSIDIQDGVPPLKLPYNNGQDPWHVAQKFIDDNDLSQLYLEQIANFILKNSTPAPVVNNSSQFYDPFTGGNRYIPSSAPQTVAQPSPVPSQKSVNTGSTLSYIPHNTFLKLEQSNIASMREKLKEFNSKSETASCRITEEQLESVLKLTTSQNEAAVSSGAIDILRSLLKWPSTLLLPILDVVRLVVLRKNVNDKFCTDELLRLLRPFLENDQQGPNQMLTFRALANMMVHETGEKLCAKHQNDLLHLTSSLTQLGNKNNQVAMSTFLLNFVISRNKANDTEGRAQVLDAILKLLPLITDPEAIFRTLVALGTLLTDPSISEGERTKFIQTMHQSQTALKFMQDACDTGSAKQTPEKVPYLAAEIINLVVWN
ncbi:hypothetical protein QAD02_023648 [Eretmocerus hayati]|uniref:Uncharacterized protein n=1 Tax=Eretmocerus hayati TaxID=131215 RepID=A0ACC2PY23_9HYME|nr:hypothetical protein QAD02_023648 [Eretmocerus hayati]